MRLDAEQLHVMVRLVRTADGIQLWAGRFDREVKDVFQIQHVIAEAVSKSNAQQTCSAIGGVLFTDIGFIPLGPTGTNLGQAYGDLQGPVAATILGPDSRGGYDVQHYWVSTSGDKIYFKQGWLKSSAVTAFGQGAAQGDLAAVRWGNYRSRMGWRNRQLRGFKGLRGYFWARGFYSPHPRAALPRHDVPRQASIYCSGSQDLL